MRKIIICAWLIIFSMSHSTLSAQNPVNQHSKIVYGTIGSYGTPPRTEDGKVDFKKLFKELKDIKANTYHWLIRDRNDGLDELKQFLPEARRKKIKVWVTIVPPSEQPPVTKSGYAEPYRLDFEKWAEELAKLSLTEKNLIVWSIDDYVHNLKFFTPEYMEKIIKASKDVNPDFLFIPCCYYKQTTDDFVKNYIGFFDGILFPYRAESEGGNLKNPDLVEKEIQELRVKIKSNIPIILDIYATAHSRLGPTTPEYLEVALREGLKSADGVLLFTHAALNDAKKLEVVKKGFKGYHR